MKQLTMKLTSKGEFFEIGPAGTSGTNAEPVPRYLNAPGTLLEIIDAARAHGDQEFLVYGRARFSFRQFFESVDALAGYLQSQGLRPGRRLAIAMRNNPEWLMAFAAGVVCGAVVVPINS